MKIILLTENQTLRSALEYEIGLLGHNVAFNTVNVGENDVVIADKISIRTSKIRTQNIIYIADSDTHDDDVPEKAVTLVHPFLLSEFRELLHEMIYGIRDDESKRSEPRTILDFYESGVTIGDVNIDLTHTEYVILNELWSAKGNAVPRAHLEDISGANKDGNMVTVYINRLREKLSKVTEKRIIKTIRGGGYAIER